MDVLEKSIVLSHCEPNIVPSAVAETNIVCANHEVIQTEESNLVTLEKPDEPSLSTLDIVTDLFVADPSPHVIDIDFSKVV